jgi:sec-independent protein translocase protein TatA
MMLSIFLGMIGWPQVVLIAVIVLLLFGGKKIPELMRGLGKGMKEFKDASKGEADSEKKDNA